MSDLIDRELVLKGQVIHYDCDGVEILSGYAVPVDYIKKLPSAQPERKKGKWIEFPNHMAYKCSECGRIIQTTDGRRNVSKHYPFCHCGADMRENHRPEYLTQWLGEPYQEGVNK